MLLCKYCTKECKNNNSLINHERLCKENPLRQALPAWHPGNNKRIGKVGANQYTKAKRLGLPVPVMTQETRIKISDAGKLQTWDIERRDKHSLAMRKAVIDNPESYTSANVCGRIKIEDYRGEKFHGKWEVEVAQWFDANDIKWIRQVTPFNYFWNDKWHLYFPDFYLSELDMFVEVKGYETDRDRCKWAVVDNLIIIKQKEIMLIRENTFSIT